MRFDFDHGQKEIGRLSHETLDEPGNGNSPFQGFFLTNEGVDKSMMDKTLFANTVNMAWFFKRPGKKNGGKRGGNKGRSR